MKRSIGSVIRQLREERGMTQRRLAEEIGVSKSAVGMWESGERSPNEEMKERIADYFNVDMNYLYGMTPVRNRYREVEGSYAYQSMGIPHMAVPLYEGVSCGGGTFVEDSADGYIAVPSTGLSPSGEYFAQRAEGDSMTGVGIDDGDTLVFMKSDTIESGKIGCFCIGEGEAVCKRVIIGNGLIQLVPANPDYDPIVIDPRETPYRVVGVLKKVIKDF